jgi:hypothetical protein
VKLAPLQEGVEGELGVTVYTTLIGAFVVFTNVPEMELAAVPAAVPVIPVTAGADHEYFVPEGITFPLPSVGVTVNVPPEQIAAVCAVVTEGTGFTVIVYVFADPEHAGPYAKTTANDFDPEQVVAPKTASDAEIVTDDCPSANEETTDIEELALHEPIE